MFNYKQELCEYYIWIRAGSFPLWLVNGRKYNQMHGGFKGKQNPFQCIDGYYRASERAKWMQRTGKKKEEIPWSDHVSKFVSDTMDLNANKQLIRGIKW